MADRQVNINFRGTEDYRKKLARAALDRGTKVQTMIEDAIESYLNQDQRSENGTDFPANRTEETTGYGENAQNLAVLNLEEWRQITHTSGVTKDDISWFQKLFRLRRTAAKTAIEQNIDQFSQDMDAIGQFSALRSAGTKFLSDLNALLASRGEDAESLRETIRILIAEHRREMAANEQETSRINKRRPTGRLRDAG